MKSTRQQLKKIPSVPCLYRHENTDVYYGIKKHRGILKSTTLDTTDRKLAERKLREWIGKLQTDIALTAPTLAVGFENLKKSKAGNSESTQKQYDWALETVKKHGSDLLKIRMDEIKPSQLAILFGSLSGWKATSYNSFTLIVKQVFDLALHDELVAKNPYNLTTTKRRKVVREPDAVPSIEQCEKIVENIGSQPFADTREVSADFCGFLHLAALGEAEANNLDWEDFDWTREVIKVRRKKTGAYFEVPFFPQLKPFIIALWEKQGKPIKGLVFKIRSVKKALYNACNRLGYSAYSPRDLRKARIVWMLRKGVAEENIAEWQGHKDNGILIRRTYAWVIDEAKAAYRQTQLAKMAA